MPRGLHFRLRHAFLVIKGVPTVWRLAPHYILNVGSYSTPLVAGARDVTVRGRCASPARRGGEAVVVNSWPVAQCDSDRQTAPVADSSISVSTRRRRRRPWIDRQRGRRTDGRTRRETAGSMQLTYSPSLYVRDVALPADKAAFTPATITRNADGECSRREFYLLKIRHEN